MVTKLDVKRSYVNHRRRIHPNYSAPSRWNACWKKIADFLQANNIELEPFMESQFELRKPFPHPTNLYNPHALERYEQYTRAGLTVEDSICNRLLFELDYLNVRSRLFGIERVIEDPAAPLSPIFRVGVATMYGLDDVVDMYRDAAREAIVGTPSLMRPDFYGQFFGSNRERAGVGI